MTEGESSLEKEEKVCIIKVPKEKMLELGMKKRYDHNVYFNDLTSDAYWSVLQYTLKIAEPNGNGIALDLGCGYGLLLPTLSRYYDEVIGIDADSTSYINASNLVSHLRLNNVRVFLMDGNSMRFKNKTFDVVFCCSILEHSKNLNVILNEIKRILKPGGKIITLSPTEGKFYSFLRFLVGFKKPKDHYLNSDEIRKLIEKFFEIKKVQRFPLNFLPKGLSLFEIILAKN